VPVIAERFTIEVGGVPVVGVLHRPRLADPCPCVVACHGMGASKDSDKYLLLAREFPAVGLALARFDFRGSGESGGSYDGSTVASRIADLQAVLDHLRRHPSLDRRFGLLGSSLGGFVAWWMAAASGLDGPVVTWNAPADLLALGAGAGVDSPGAPAALVNEVKAGRHAEAPSGVAGVLVVQGDRDEVVPPEHGRRLFARACPPRELCLIAGADHRLTDQAHRQEALERSRAWLLRWLAGSRGVPGAASSSL
jgi:alpha-beta hydrolase superfamily lysophospholipase